MKNLPEPGNRVRWRDFEHACCLGWADAIGAGPFAVVRIVDHSAEKVPPGIVLKTDLGEREINSVWFATVDEPEEVQAGAPSGTGDGWDPGPRASDGAAIGRWGNATELLHGAGGIHGRER